MISELKEGDELLSILALVRQSEIRTDKKGNPRMILVLTDKTGEIEGIYWGWSGPATHKGVIAEFSGRVGSYGGSLQLTIDSVTAADPAKVNIADFRPSSEISSAVLFERIEKIISLHVKTDPMRSMLRAMIEKTKARLAVAPAGVSMHHAYVGGLLEHIDSLCGASVQLYYHYKELDIELMIATAILHDIGKLYELNYEVEFSYSRTGQLLGHVTIGLMMAAEATKGWDPVLREKLLHCIGSHHGLLEYGATVVPRLPEALAFSALDNLDAKLAAVRAAAKRSVDPDGFTDRIPSLGTAFYVGPR